MHFYVQLLSYVPSHFSAGSPGERPRPGSLLLPCKNAHPYSRIFEMLWQEPACLRQVKREVDHLSQTIPRAHLLEQEALKKTSYPDLLIRAISAESMADVESRRNRELQCKLDALQSGLGALRSEQEKTTNVLQQVADRPAVVNHTYNDNRSYSSLSFMYSDQSSWRDNRQINVLAVDSDRVSVRKLLASC